MKLLAIETATEACSAALFVDGEVEERFQVAPRDHARLILTMVDDLLLDAGIAVGELDGLAFGRGPGSFTGVRIATGVAQGIAFGADLPVVPVSTLAALAQGALMDLGAPRVAVALDARMGEVYWGAYMTRGDGIMVTAEAERVCAPEAVPPLRDGVWLGVGSGWGPYGDILHHCCHERLDGMAPERYPAARDVAWLGVHGLRNGRAVAPERALPVYLRDNVAKKPVSSF